MKIADAYMEKALSWIYIKCDDGNTLHAYVCYLRGCSNAMKELKSIGEVDRASTLKLIVSKLLYLSERNIGEPQYMKPTGGLILRHCYIY